MLEITHSSNVKLFSPAQAAPTPPACRAWEPGRLNKTTDGWFQKETCLTLPISPMSSCEQHFRHLPADVRQLQRHEIYDLDAPMSSCEAARWPFYSQQGGNEAFQRDLRTPRYRFSMAWRLFELFGDTEGPLGIREGLRDVASCLLFEMGVKSRKRELDRMHIFWYSLFHRYNILQLWVY